ncbi:MAG: hypothetical protein COA50_05780 [Flavobacteriaceae bacterium]|nr:MAG: hypothetical protein COA50_05780 [Flavobacteriaceae bacterium]
MKKYAILFCLLFIAQSLISQVNLSENKAATKTKNEAIVTSKINLRQPPQAITILWDNSLSMNNRLLYKELQFLDAYFKKNRNVKVKFQTFGTDLGAVQKHKVTEGNWEALKHTLLEVVYDGATSKEVLKKLRIGGHTLLFTDGNRFNENIDRKWKGAVFTINSKRDANHALLKSIAEDSDASYINLEKTLDMSVAITYTNQHVTDKKNIVKRNKQLLYKKK